MTTTSGKPKKYQPTTFSPSHFRRSLSGADITDLQYRILVVLCEHSQMDKPNVKVSNERLAEHCGVKNPDTIRKHLNCLEQKGFIQSVGRRFGGNQGANRWRLIYTGMRNRTDNGQPMWDALGWDKDIFVSAPECTECGADQPPLASGQPHPQTPPTPSTDATNPIQPEGPSSSYEVERSKNFEVDAPSVARRCAPDGARVGASSAQGEKGKPQPPINDDDPALKIWEHWEDWWFDRVNDDRIRETRPHPNCGHDRHKHLSQPAPGCQPCAKAAQKAAAWQAAHDEWRADCRHKRDAVHSCNACDDEGLQILEDRRERWCDHQAAKQAAAAEAEAAAAAAEAEQQRQTEITEIRNHAFAAVFNQHGGTDLANRAANMAADTVDEYIQETGRIPTVDEVVAGALKLASDWVAEAEAAAAKADALAAEAVELEAEDLQEEHDCTDCGPPGPKSGNCYIKADDGAPLVAVFPPGRAPHWMDYRENQYGRSAPGNKRGGFLEMFTMPIGPPEKPVGVLDYAQIFCDHSENNRLTVKELVEDHGARIMPMTKLGDAGNGFGIRALTDGDGTDTITPIASYVTPAALPAAEVVDVELVDDPWCDTEPAPHSGDLSVSEEIPDPTP